MPAYLIDLHCHPSFKPHYNAVTRSAINLWEPIPAEEHLQDQLSAQVTKILDGTRLDSQSNLLELSRGKVRGLFVAIHPMERGWLKHKEYSSHPVRDLLLRCVLREEDIPALGALLSGVPIATVTEMKNKVDRDDEVNYYHEDTYPEYDFLVKATEQTHPSGIKFQIVSNFTEYVDVIANKPNTIAGIITLEGGHALLQMEHLSWQERNYSDLPEESRRYIFNKYVLNIQKIKGLNSFKGFKPEHTPFFITLAHFFNNFLVGHAKSFGEGIGVLPGMDTLLDQEQELNAGISELGLLVIERLLRKSDQERRILIDVKHMSWQARKEYYAILQQRGSDVPIIFSHGGVNGKNAADFEARGVDRIDDIANEYLSRWSINLLDEDIREIVASDGLMGIAPHEGRVPGGGGLDLFKVQKRIRDFDDHRRPDAENQLRREYISVLLSNFYHIADVIGGAKAWDHVCVGSDYDGVMNPFDSYPNSGDLDRLLTDMLPLMENPPARIHSYRHGRPFVLTAAEQRRLQFGIAPSELIAKIAFRNIELFLSKYFNRRYLGGKVGGIV